MGRMRQMVVVVTPTKATITAGSGVCDIVFVSVCGGGGDCCRSDRLRKVVGRLLLLLLLIDDDDDDDDVVVVVIAAVVGFGFDKCLIQCELGSIG